MADLDPDLQMFQKLQNFCEINEQFKIVFNKTEENSRFPRHVLNETYLNYIGHELLHIPQYLEDITTYFSEEIPRLLAFAIFFDDEFYKFSQSRHAVNCGLLGRILKYRPDLSGYALKYFEKYGAPFEDSIVVSSKKSKKNKNISISDLEVVECCYQLLLKDPEFYRIKWDWSKFIGKYYNDTDVRVKWIAARCIGILINLNDKQLETLILSSVATEVNEKFMYIFDEKSTLTEYNSKPPLDSKPALNFSINKVIQTIDVSGVHILSKPHFLPIKTTLIEVESTKNNLRKIALGLTLKKAICLQGPVGCGKTALVEHLASKTGRELGKDFVKIQLGDQMDSKMLLGTYRCTDVPGEFVWQAGVLTRAVIEGNWLLMEDIDLANMDIASVLTNLLESKTLTIPGFRDNVQITPGFQLFLTRRFISTITGHHKKHSNSMALIEKHLIQINIDPFSTDELKQIILEKHSQFRFITERIIEVFKLFSHDSICSSPSKNGRLTSTRDLFKWCSRAIVGFDPKSQASALKVLQDAIDIFCCAHSDSEEMLNMARNISSVLGIVNQNAEYFCQTYKPTIELTTDSFLVGRVAMLKNQKHSPKNIKFSFTRPSAVLLERIMCCVKSAEPVLLVGETGTGKTSTIQYLANIIGQKLVVINMNQQSDSADLLGGFKPVDLKFVINPLKEEFESVFCDYFKMEPNIKFLKNISYCFENARWSDLIKLMQKSYEAAVNRLNKSIPVESEKRKRTLDEDENEKGNKKNLMMARWKSVGEKLEKLKLQLKQKTALAFAFIEGTLVKAVQKGYWVLLDEINLANAETLECLSGLLEGSNGSICLLERGDKEPIKRHSNFTLFACMNPSTDVGKRELPAGLRNRFTEFFVHELTERNDLLLLVVSYLQSLTFKEKELNKIVDFYLKVRKEAQTNLLDGIGHKPHYSLRSLCRALSIASKNPCGMLKRSLYEAFCLSFLTQLDVDSYRIVENMITSHILGKNLEVKAVLNQPIPKPQGSSNVEFIQFEAYWVQKGNLDCLIPDDYILTDSVRKNLRDLVRVVSIGKLPVLLQGDTSVGKTSLITYLAKASGNKCVRINNHEHTDLQEYIGSYAADSTGKLVFREGLLVEAMRQGHWIILDELNLAPTDVLEALNRVLDDNRELFIPETQQVVRAHHNFMLFATQNPPGSYGGRKRLSRAFRNRFVELHFTEIPPKELETILHRRCHVAPSYAKKMISVMTDLQLRRRGSAAFAGKHGFITLRDLFRWGERYRLADVKDNLYDWDQHLADEGYLILAGRVRKNEEKMEIISVLQKHLKREVNPSNLFSLSSTTSTVTKKILEDLLNNTEKHKNIVWTYSMRQLAVLVGKALQFKEPVLLVGETGGGKTTVCKVIADIHGQELMTVNCHMHTESSDFIGGLRPVRNHEASDKLFEWVNGPLIQSMQKGCVFLADEISLADDSVLERLNSLLEPERCLLLAEKGTDINNQHTSELIIAKENFHFIGTMNPGGDFGKKELSPALRNRFTEIWCEPCTDRADLIAIIEANIKDGVSFGNQEDGSSGIGLRILNFIEWFKTHDIGSKFTISIRDILTWVNFINACSESVDISELYVHGASLTFLDSFGSGLTSGENPKALDEFKDACLSFLNNQLSAAGFSRINMCVDELQLMVVEDKIGIKPFFIDLDDQVDDIKKFYFNAPTTLFNSMRILRGMQLHKAILLEGSPGVGKTSLITALAEFSGHKIYRINLSDQTDISDLFGADLPVEGGTGGQFSWKDGPLLQALKQGHWILLDELNLASQSVLEGLNACLDHRGEIFIPELGKTFYVENGTRFFAAQNPLKQGGSRRGLPQSFLNRFIQVYINALSTKDLHFIVSKQFPQMPIETIEKMIAFNTLIDDELREHKFGHKGSPWECNLRDLTRWCEATIFHYNSNKTDKNHHYHPEALVNLLYGDRMRTLEDKGKVREIFQTVFGFGITGTTPILYFNKDRVYFGDVSLNINSEVGLENQGPENTPSLVLRSQLSTLRSLSYCINLGWMSILVGTSGSGKSSVVKTLANLAGKTLKTFPVTSAMDTTDILGGFEQTDYARHLDELSRRTNVILNERLRVLLLKNETQKAISLLELWESFLHLQGKEIKTIKEEIRIFICKLDNLSSVWDYLFDLGLETDDSLEKLRRKAAILRKGVKNDGSLNAGGKFEWVDSVLIKCLQNGYWLLVDNVNLCSSAVLDRLNALLEPHGVLTIGERGVDKNGKMFVITPHKDFRLFLTMDPKNGEISRAMRNRGVEIYMINDRESLETNDIDLKSMIQVNGLKNKNHIRTLIQMHDFLSDLILGEKPTTNELIQSASCISQQIRYGTDELQAFYSTLIEVYYKTRPAIEFGTDDISGTVKHKVKSLIDASHLMDNLAGIDSYNEHFTIRTDSLEESLELKKFKQQSALIASVLDEDNERNHENILEYFLIMFYSTSTKRDLISRHNYMKYKLRNKKNTQLENFIECLFTELSENAQFPDVDLPFDFRWIPDTTHSNRMDPDVNRTVLKFFLMIYYYNENKLKNLKTSNFTLLDYMQARKANKVVDKFNDIIINKFLELIEAFDSSLNTTLKSDLKLTNNEVIAIIFLMKWRFSFFKCVLVDFKNKQVRHKLLTNLKVHYSWFIKYSVEKSKNTLKYIMSEELHMILKEIDKIMNKQSTGLFKLGKNYQKFSNKPTPYTERSKLDIMSEYENINYLYNICDRRNEVGKILKLTCDDSYMRTILINIKMNFNRSDISEIMDVLKITHSKNIEGCSKELDKFQVELIPLVDYLEQLEIRRAISTNDHNCKAIESSRLIPTDLIGAYSKYTTSGDKRLYHELMKIFFLYLIDSPIQHLEEYLGKEKLSVVLNSYHPRLSYYLINLLINSECNEVKTTKLGNFRSLIRQHQTLNTTLWSNVKALHSNEYNPIVLESSYIHLDANKFLHQLASSLNIDVARLDIDEIVEKCVQNIEEFKNLSTSTEHHENINRFKEILVKCFKNIQYLSTSNDVEKNMLNISNIHIKLGYLKLILDTQLHLIDPLMKKSMKKEYCEQAILEFERMKTCYELQNKVYSPSCATVHELHKPIKEMIGNLMKKTQSLSEYVAVRSEKIEYEAVLKSVTYGMSSILSIDTYVKIKEIDTLIDGLISARTKKQKFCTKHAKTILSQHESSIHSYENIILDWSKYRISYPDIIEPPLCDVAQFLYGFKMEISLLKKSIQKLEFEKMGIPINETLMNLVIYPVVDENHESYIEQVVGCISENMQTFINTTLGDGSRNRADTENFRLLMCCLQEAFNVCVVDGKYCGTLTKTLYQKFTELVKKFVEAYNAQESKKEVEEKESENLYKMKTKCKELPEDEQIEAELRELFPNFHTIDFPDMQTVLEMTDEPEIENKQLECLHQISYDDLKFVSELHTNLVKNYTQCEWLNPKKDKNVICNFINPLLQRFKTFRQLMDKAILSLEFGMDQQLFGSFVVLLGVIQHYGNENSLDDQVTSPTKLLTNGNRDFYKDPDVEEVKSGFHVLEELRVRVQQLLDEWPEQPTLKTITTIIDRIYNFDITSPISRFLTGFEILLNKCHEWEQVAHSKVSLSLHEQSLTEQIISWRKKELTMWKNLLNSTFSKLNDSKSKWWLYLFNITEQYIGEDLFTADELITTLQKFITSSNIAEFESRLDLLFSFHCYTVNIDSINHKRIRIYNSILWNIYQYYDQFRTSVTTKIKDLRAPIEKKLKDYIKIVKWKDISYWSVKETVDKTHKILHKHMREFKDVMQQPVLKFLVHTSISNNREENVGIWDRPQRQSPKKYHYTLDSSSYIAKTIQGKIKANVELSLGEEYEVLPKIDSYFLKSRKLCKDVIESIAYPNLVRDLDEFVGEVIATSTHLQNLEVDTTLLKNKQKSQAKSILQQKHRALADLFKTLSKIGLSFRTGMVDQTIRKNVEDFTIKPIDLKSSCSQIGISRNDEKLLTIWDSSELYYIRSLIRFDALESTLLQPAKDLGSNNIQRCQGYTAHLLSLTLEQKIEMIEMSRNFYYLRYYFGSISRYCDAGEYLKNDYIDDLNEFLKNIIIVSNQYKIILNTCPTEDNLDPVEIVSLRCDKNSFFKYKYDETWTKVYETFNQLISLAEKNLTIIKKSKADMPCSEHELLRPKFIPINDKQLIFDQLNIISEKIENILFIIGETQLASSLKWLQTKVFNIKSNTTCNDRNEMNSCDVEAFRMRIEKSSLKILKIIQEIYKKYSTSTEIIATDLEDTESQLQDDHLKVKVIASLLEDIRQLDAKKILKSVSKVVDCLFSLELPLNEDTKKTANQYLILLDQIILLYQYFLTQQVSAYRVTCKLNSVILSIFIELAGKGFCVPPEFSDEMEGEGVGQPSDGMGLGDGQGEKDVSDKIESEDQLDDTHVEGQEKEKEEDPDCKEEDKGIEMSEDFDSKLQDKEKKENDDEESEDNSDSDAEEQMGETGKGADKLDEEIWGSDDEKDDQGSEGEGDQEEESGNKGEDERDHQMGAKEKDSKNEPSEEDKKESEKDREKNKKDINEMEEPEYDEEQVDPYHGNLPEPPEPEPMDLPDDLKLDNGADDENDKEEENPFDTDTTKEQDIPEDKEPDAEEGQNEEKQRDEINEFSSDDEDIKNDDNNEHDAQEETQNEDNELKEDEGDSKDDEKNAEMDEEKQEVQETEESALDQNQTKEDRVEAMDVENTDAADKTQAIDSENKSSQPIDELNQEDRSDNDGMGQSQMEESKSGHSSQTNKPQEMDTSKNENNEDLKRKQKPGETDSQRSLGDVNEPVQKKLKTMDAEDDGRNTDEKEPNDQAKSEIYKHIKDAEESVTQVLDTATKEQAEAQNEKTVPENEDEETEEPTESSKDLPDEEDEKVDIAEGSKQKPEKLEDQKDKTKEKRSHPEGEILEELETMEIDGEVVQTSTVPRGAESSHHTLFTEKESNIRSILSIEEVNNLRHEVEQQMSSWYEPPSDKDAERTWQKISSVTSSLAQELSEQLRLVLEPTQASRLKGDYRTGRRINMRKVIPYIASQFRKDKIWLRRTKPSKREYQIVLAIDDSSSMADNKSKEMAFESVALISQALTLLESGQLSVVSFGEQTEVLHKLSDQFTEKSGVKLLQKFKFAQTKTCLAKLVDFTTEMLNQSQFHSSSLNARLLIIVSDGRGVFSEGETVMRQAVRRGKLANIFTIFVIIDNPENKNSVLDIRMPVFKDGKLLAINNYMDVFPFSFYIILRDLVSLPNVLSDALRQWFEIVSNLDK